MKLFLLCPVSTTRDDIYKYVVTSYTQFESLLTNYVTKYQTVCKSTTSQHGATFPCMFSKPLNFFTLDNCFLLINKQNISLGFMRKMDMISEPLYKWLHCKLTHKFLLTLQKMSKLTCPTLPHQGVSWLISGSIFQIHFKPTKWSNHQYFPISRSFFSQSRVHSLTMLHIMNSKVLAGTCINGKKET